MQKQKVPSTHSEGYFSSEDDTKRKTDQLSERLKQLGKHIYIFYFSAFEAYNSVKLFIINLLEIEKEIRY